MNDSPWGLRRVAKKDNEDKKPPAAAAVTEDTEKDCREDAEKDCREGECADSLFQRIAKHLKVTPRAN